MRDVSKGYALVMLAVLFFGSQGTFGKGLMNSGVHPVSLAALRLLLAALLFLVYILMSDPKSLRVRREDYLYLLCFGLFTTGVLRLSFNYAIFYTGVATSSILLYTAPAFVTVLSIFLFSEKPTVKRVLALMLTMLGCFFIARASAQLDFNLLGVGFGVVAGFTYALWSIMSKKGLARYPAPVLNFYNLLIAGLMLLVASLAIAGPQSVAISPNQWGGVLLMALFNTFIPYTFYVGALHHIPASKASILANFELVIAVLLSYLVFQEPFTLYKTLGFVAIGTGIFLIMREDYRKSVSERRSRGLG